MATGAQGTVQRIRERRHGLADFVFVLVVSDVVDVAVVDNDNDEEEENVVALLLPPSPSAAASVNDSQNDCFFFRFKFFPSRKKIV